MENKEYYRKNKNQYLYRASPEALKKLNEFAKDYTLNKNTILDFLIITFLDNKSIKRILRNS